MDCWRVKGVNMKLGAKIFFYITIFFSVAFLFAGYILISYFYEITMNREIETAVEQYQYNKFVVQANLITRGEGWFTDTTSGEYDISSIVADMNNTVAFFSLDKRTLFSDFPEETEFSTLLADAASDNVSYQFFQIKGRTYLLVAGIVEYDDTGVYLVTGVDVERVSEQQEQIVRKFEAVYAAAIGIAALLIFGMSALLTKPVKLLTIATKKIADGNYNERVAGVGEDEVGQLARNFNQMAVAIEEKVQELSDSAKQKEDFVTNFAHELKTPLTSIIGYADRIYQKELSKEEQKKAAWYIWNEGMRLESLSLKLMDLTNLNHKDFELQEVRADVLFEELRSDVDYLVTEKNISLSCSAEVAYIDVEYDLFKTLFLNLIDNSIKAGADYIQVSGRVEMEGSAASGRERDFSGLRYIIQVEDNGCGIPAQEIKRITEAFYMVDKSRSRKLHGAGIGLALSERIAQIHGSRLEFESDGKSGTTVRICLKCKGAEDDE